MPWVIALALGIVVFVGLPWLASRRSAHDPEPFWAARWIGIIVAVVTVIAASGALVELVRIGHSGAKASWSDVSSAAQPGLSLASSIQSESSLDLDPDQYP